MLCAEHLRADVTINSAVDTRYFLGIKKAYSHLHIASDSRVEALGGHLEICDCDDSGTLFGKCYHFSSRSLDDHCSSLVALCSEQLMDSIQFERLPQVFSAIRVQLS